MNWNHSFCPRMNSSTYRLMPEPLIYKCIVTIVLDIFNLGLVERTLVLKISTRSYSDQPAQLQKVARKAKLSLYLVLENE